MGEEAERWWSQDTLAVVTGANKGIGLEIVCQLAKEAITVVITARDATHGTEAIESLKKQGFHNVNFHTLDVCSQESINAFAEWLCAMYGGFDILINNAGILDDLNKVSLENAKAVFATNYFGVKNVTKILLPLLHDNTPGGARLIVVASRLGQLKALQNKDYVRALSDMEHLTEDFVYSFANKYLEEVANGTQNEGGWSDWTKLGLIWPYETYPVSKIAPIECLI